MEKFIRIDQIGHWRGNEHCSSFGDVEDTITEYDFEFDPVTGEEIMIETERPAGILERGISCYSLNNTDEAIINLYEYWGSNWNHYLPKHFEGKQITIFEGERTYNDFQRAYGADGEDLAECVNTIAELDAVSFMSKVFAAKGRYEDDEITEDEYNSTLENIYNETLSEIYKRVG